jgi:hypothetical protein
MLLQLYLSHQSAILFHLCVYQNGFCTYSSQNAGYLLIEAKAFAISILYLEAIIHRFERRRDVRVNPKRPKCVVDIEDDDFGKGETVDEYG